MDRRVEAYLTGLMVERAGDVEHHFRWEHEVELLLCVREGRPDRLESVLASQREAYAQTMGDVRFAARKEDRDMYHFVSAVTNFCHAAIEGGVPEILAYSMMESYIYCADRYRGDYGDYFLDAVYSFAGAVADYRIGIGDESPQLRKIKTYVMANLNNPIRLGDVAALLRLSPSRCSHLFREKTGMTLREYIERERIHAAFAYLAYMDKPISWLSEYLCFSSPSHFASVFRRHTGLSPGQWQKQNRRRP